MNRPVKSKQSRKAEHLDKWISRAHKAETAEKALQAEVDTNDEIIGNLEHRLYALTQLYITA